MKKLPIRKQNRLPGHDYSQNAAYFVTVCVKDKHEMLSKVVSGEAVGIPHIEFSEYGKIACETLIDLPNHNSSISIDKYVVMPNHIHCIISICRERSVTVPLRKIHGIPEIIRQFKTFSTMRINEWQVRNGYEPFPTFWQKSYHDHIIRNADEYKRIWQYIDGNPARWQDDQYYTL